MAEKLKLCCSECDFTTLDAEAFVDHMLITKHASAPGAVGTDGRGLAELIKAIQTIQDDPRGEHLPEGASIQSISMDEIEDDPGIPESEKVKIRGFMKRVFDKADEKE